MAGYHISDGEAKPCNAKKKCPIGGEHFSTMSDAMREAHRQLQEKFKDIPDPVKRERYIRMGAKAAEREQRIEAALSKTSFDTLVLNETRKNDALTELTGKGKEMTYVLRSSKTGKTFALYFNSEGGVARKSTLHDSLEEAKAWISKVEKGEE